MTGGDIGIGDFTYPVTGDLSTKQFYAVYLNGATLSVCPTGNYGMLGILQDNPNATSTGVNKTTVGSVREMGHSKAWIDYDGAAPVVAGSPLRVSTTTAGMLELGAVGTDVIVAIACETASTAADSLIEVALTARTAQGMPAARSGQLVFSVPMVNLGTAAGSVVVVTTAPMGFTGTITNMYAVPSKVASTAGATVLSAAITGQAVTTLACTCSNAALQTTHGTAITGVASTANNTFGPTDTLSISSNSSVTFAGDTGTLEIHVITN
jgi:hypothetical protein